MPCFTAFPRPSLVQNGCWAKLNEIFLLDLQISVGTSHIMWPTYFVRGWRHRRAVFFKNQSRGPYTPSLEVFEQNGRTSSFQLRSTSMYLRCSDALLEVCRICTFTYIYPVFCSTFFSSLELYHSSKKSRNKTFFVRAPPSMKTIIHWRYHHWIRLWLQNSPRNMCPEEINFLFFCLEHMLLVQLNSRSENESHSKNSQLNLVNSCCKGNQVSSS